MSLSLLIAGCVPVSGDAAASGGVESSSRVVRLTDADFDQQVRPNEGDNGDWFVEFYAPVRRTHQRGEGTHSDDE